MSVSRKKFHIAAKNADWQQVVLNGGPPCFSVEGDRFCLRAERWAGHGPAHDPSAHVFVSLDSLLTKYGKASSLPAEQEPR